MLERIADHFSPYNSGYSGGLPEIVCEYTLTDPYIYPGAAPHPASLKPKLPLKQAYPGFNPSPEPLQPFEPGLLLICTPLSTYLPSFRDTDLLNSAIFQPVLISLRVETPVASHRL